MHITPLKRIWYSAIIGLGLVAIYTLIFPLPYSSVIDALAIEVLFALGYSACWLWLAAEPEPQTIQVILNDPGVGHEVIETRMLANHIN